MYVYCMNELEMAFRYARLGFNRKLYDLLTKTPSLQKAVHNDSTLLITAVKNEQVRSFDMLLSFPNVMSMVNYKDSSGMTALMWATDNDNAYMITMLLKHKSNKRIKYPVSKLTAFETALARKQVTVAHFLNSKEDVAQERLRGLHKSVNSCDTHVKSILTKIKEEYKIK